MSDELTVRDNAEQARYEALVGSEVVGFTAYRLEPERITLVHTEIDPAFEGHGIASRLVAGAIDDIRERGLTLVAVCPFVRSYLERHPENADLTARR